VKIRPFTEGKENGGPTPKQDENLFGSKGFTPRVSNLWKTQSSDSDSTRSIWSTLRPLKFPLHNLLLGAGYIGAKKLHEGGLGWTRPGRTYLIALCSLKPRRGVARPFRGGNPRLVKPLVWPRWGVTMCKLASVFNGTTKEWETLEINRVLLGRSPLICAGEKEQEQSDVS